ncbi:DinB family protein [Paenibacillus sp. CAU 1782]
MIGTPSAEEYASFYEKYVTLVPEGNVIEHLEEQGKDVQALLASLTEEQGNYRYETGKWSVKEVIGHLNDSERIMSNRLLRVGRGDKTPQPGFDQDVLMQNDPFGSYTVAEIAEDHAAIRRSSLALLKKLAPEAWLQMGVVSDHPASARSIAYVIAGHELHHLNIIKERYLAK